MASYSITGPVKRSIGAVGSVGAEPRDPIGRDAARGEGRAQRLGTGGRVGVEVLLADGIHLGERTNALRNNFV